MEVRVTVSTGDWEGRWREEVFQEDCHREEMKRPRRGGRREGETHCVREGS
jgi:hypothetical protein